MVRIEKMYFTLKEVARRWGVRKCDIAYMVENGMLRTSVHLVDVHLERGLLEVDRNQEFHMPNEQIWYTGLLDVMVRDAVLVLRRGEAHVVHFHAEKDEYALLIQPTGPAEIRAKHLVVRRCERDRVEAHYGETGNTVAEGIAFQHADGYRSVRLGDLRFALGPVQAKVVELLHESALSGEPWRCGKAILAEAGAASMRMSDVFKSQSRSQDLIESDRRGRYQLRLKMR